MFANSIAQNNTVRPSAVRRILSAVANSRMLQVILTAIVALTISGIHSALAAPAELQRWWQTCNQYPEVHKGFAHCTWSRIWVHEDGTQTLVTQEVGVSDGLNTGYNASAQDRVMVHVVQLPTEWNATGTRQFDGLFTVGDGATGTLQYGLWNQIIQEPEYN